MTWSLANGEDGMRRPRGCTLEPAENAAFLGTRNGVGWQTADKHPEPGVRVDILLDWSQAGFPDSFMLSEMAMFHHLSKVLSQLPRCLQPRRAVEE